MFCGHKFLLGETWTDKFIIWCFTVFYDKSLGQQENKNEVVKTSEFRLYSQRLSGLQKRPLNLKVHILILSLFLTG